MAVHNTISLSELSFLITLVDIVLTTVKLVISYTKMNNFPVSYMQLGPGLLVFVIFLREVILSKSNWNIYTRFTYLVCLQFQFTTNGLLYRFPHVCSIGVLKTREKYGRVYRFDISKIPMSLEWIFHHIYKDGGCFTGWLYPEKELYCSNKVLYKPVTRLFVPIELYLLFVFPYISTMSMVPKWFLFHFCRHLMKNRIRF